MTINHEVKGQLAKLLATEDLVVEHRAVETAQFNVHTRVLTLPQWNKASNTVYDLLVGHEVGHALYTPDEDWIKERKISPQVVNVVEDARIEKFMKRRYAGLSKTFYRGYQELAEEDFFCINDEDISTFNLADKINLYCKIGNYVDIQFNSKEESLLHAVLDCETFAEVLDVSEEIYKYCKDVQKTESPADVQLQSNNGGSSPQPQGSDSQEGESESSSSESLEGTDNPNDDDLQGSSQDLTDGPSMGGDHDDFNVETLESLEDAIKDLTSDQSFENQYLEIPKVNLGAIIIPNDEVYEYVPEKWDSVNPECFYGVDKRYGEFKKSAQKEVNYLVKEFECRKSASAYARSATARTGVLDCTKLHTYKYNEDLFRKINVVPDGKNHGLIFILDWSGSMSDVLVDTVKQLYNLIWFCKKVNIPFDVYAFTSDFPKIKTRIDENGERKYDYPPEPYKKGDGFVQVYEQFSLMNMFSSKTKIKELDNQMKTIFRVAEGFSREYYTYYPIPNGLSLSGTPLNDTLITLHEIIPEFKKINNVEKVQCVILTDGEAPPLKYHKIVQRHWEKEPYLGIRQVCNNNCILRDRKLGTTYSLNGNWYEITDILLTHLKDKFKDTNFIGIRVLEGRDAHSFIARYVGRWNDDHDRLHGIWRKERTFTITNSGYHSYFAMSANSLSQENNFEVKEDATKSQIKSAFVKSLRTKKMNKRVLNEFIDLVA